MADDTDGAGVPDDVDAVRLERVVTTSGVAGTSSPANTWVLGDDEEVIVIDPGDDSADVLEAVGDREVLAVVCTHGRGDAAAIAQVAARDEAPIALHRRDRILWRSVDVEPQIDMEDGGVFEVADLALEVRHTPGFSPGSVCLYCEDLGVVFTGWTLLADGPGPHPDADFPTQLTSVGERLLPLPPDTRVLPARGEEAVIADLEAEFDRWVAAGPRVDDA